MARLLPVLLMFCSTNACPLPKGQSSGDHASSLQAARQSAEAEAESLKAEVDAVVARQQERVADWEAAVAEEESALAAKQQELQASHASCTCNYCHRVLHLLSPQHTPGPQAFHQPNRCFSPTKQMYFIHQTSALHPANR